MFPTQVASDILRWPGFTGDRCELEYNECESSPCANGGTCSDRVGGFSCVCSRGYTGTSCQLKVNTTLYFKAHRVL